MSMKRFRFWLSLCIASVLACFLAAAALAAGTTNVSVGSDQYYDLGVGPMLVQSSATPVNLTASDSQPTVGAPVMLGAAGYVAPVLVNSPTHVWAIAPAGKTVAVTVTPAAGSGGGGAGPITQSSVSVTNASTPLLTAAQFTNFEKICVALTASTGIWINWAGVAAVAGAPSEYVPPGQCDSWVKNSGFLPTSAAFAISNSSATVAATVEGN